MDPYTFSLTLGGVGLGVMALSGFAQAIHAGHSHGAHAHSSHGHADHAHDHTAAHVAHGVPRAHMSSKLLALLSPRVAFSVLVGFGAAGLLLQPVLAEPWLLLASLGGGVGFEWLAVGPLWRFLFRFASAPAMTLESAIDDEARAVTSFDASGHGLVAVELDGQVVQLLATLTAAERNAARKVRAGDRLRIEAVDTARNRCTVTYLGA